MDSQDPHGMCVQRKNLGVMAEALASNPGTSYHSTDSRHASSPSHSGFRSSSESVGGMLNVTPRASFHSNSIAAELVKEISALEFEIAHLERYLLSLYRTAFNQYLVDSSSSARHLSFSSSIHGGVSFNDIQDHIKYQDKMVHLQCSAANDGFLVKETNKSHKLESCNEGFRCSESYHAVSHADSGAVTDSGTSTQKDMKKAVSNHLSLADHLCASLRENVFETPCKLSEDMVKCISAVYCKLNNATTPQTELYSPISSLSSSSTFSPKDQSDNWSPWCYSEGTQSLQKGKVGPYSGMVEISRICINRDRFKCAAALLEGHRILVRRLQTTDPSKLEHEEKLAFWVNVHNAMVMHAYIAYGLENNHIRSTPSVLKKSYNVGGQNFNAYEIQCSILGCRPHRSEVSIRSLFSPSVKLTNVKNRHPYALDHPEPLVHFALCLGAHSDPAVRLYTAKNVTKQLQLARNEFIQANLFIQRENRIFLPKILDFYAKDASLDLPLLLDIVHDCLPENQRKALQECIKGKLGKYVQWSSYKSSFRYALHRDLDLVKL